MVKFNGKLHVQAISITVHIPTQEGETKQRQNKKQQWVCRTWSWRTSRVAPIAAHPNTVPGRGVAPNRGRGRKRGAAQNSQLASGYNDIDGDGPGEFPAFNPGHDIGPQLPQKFQPTCELAIF